MKRFLLSISLGCLVLSSCSWGSEQCPDEQELGNFFSVMLAADKEQAFLVGKSVFEEMIRNKNMPGFEFVTEKTLSNVAFSVAQYKALTEVVDDTVYLHKYVADSVYEGEEKPVSAFMLAQYYLQKKELERAMHYADIAETHWSVDEKDLVYNLRAVLAGMSGDLTSAEQYMIRAGQCTQNQQFIDDLPQALAAIRRLKTKQKKSCCFLV